MKPQTPNYTANPICPGLTSDLVTFIGRKLSNHLLYTLKEMFSDYPKWFAEIEKILVDH